MYVDESKTWSELFFIFVDASSTALETAEGTIDVFTSKSVIASLARFPDQSVATVPFALRVVIPINRESG